MRDYQTILAELEAKRDEMAVYGMAYGLCHESTVYVSQEVDRLHNEFNAAMGRHTKGAHSA